MNTDLFIILCMLLVVLNFKQYSSYFSKRLRTVHVSCRFNNEIVKIRVVIITKSKFKFLSLP